MLIRKYWCVFKRLSLTLAMASSFSLMAAPKEPFNNPGGKWMPHQLAQHAETLRRLGLEISVDELSNMESGLLQAIVSLGFCSGSFISGDGLIITNHHCVQRMLNYMSQVDKSNGTNSDFIQNGFLAKNRQEERSAGPAQKIFITQKIEDVTSTILGGIDLISDAQTRYQTIENRIKGLVRIREKDRPHMRVEVKPFYRGGKYFLIEQLELRDIRVVYAPPKGVGYYGGDTANWEWERYTGDFALIRAYVAADGTSKAFDSNNVPFHNPRHLPISRTGLSPNDLIFVAGYPGRTNRLVTAEEVRDEVEHSLPEGVEYLKGLKAILERMAKADSVIYGKTEATRFSMDNVIKKNANALEALKRIQFVETSAKKQEAFVQWLNSDASRRARYGDILQDISTVQHRYASVNSDATIGRLGGYVDLVASAITIARLAEEKTKPDAQRNPGYQERDLTNLESAEEARQRIYHREVNIASMVYVLKKAFASTAAAQRPAYLIPFFQNGVLNENMVRGMFERTTLEDKNERVNLLRTATPESLRQSTDPLLQFALQLTPLLKTKLEQSKAYSGDMAPVMVRYVAAMEEFAASQGQSLAPDANSTLRLTYGQVSGYRSPVTGRYHAPFTNLSGLMATHQINDGEFEVPYNVQQAIARRQGENFADAMYGDVPVNFLASVDTTGGNSGSAAINARGELVGLLFDGNRDFLYTDWQFDNKVRSILVSTSYFLWTLDQVEKAHDLMKEMNITPACEGLLSSQTNSPTGTRG